jgi:hypothetical protein
MTNESPAVQSLQLSDAFEFEMSCEIVDEVITKYPVLIPLWKLFGVDVQHDCSWCCRHYYEQPRIYDIRICKVIQDKHPEAFQDVLESADDHVLINIGNGVKALYAYARSVAGAANVVFRFFFGLGESDIRQWPRVLREQQAAMLVTRDQNDDSDDYKLLLVVCHFFHDHADFYEIIRTGTPNANGYQLQDVGYHFEHTDCGRLFAMQHMLRAWPELQWEYVNCEDSPGSQHIGRVIVHNLWGENRELLQTHQFIDDPRPLDLVWQTETHPCYLQLPHFNECDAFDLISHARATAAFFSNWQHSLQDIDRLPGPEEFSVTSLIRARVIRFLEQYPSFVSGFLPLRQDLGFCCNDWGTLFCWGYWLYRHTDPSAAPHWICLEKQLVVMFQVCVWLCVRSFVLMLFLSTMLDTHTS